MQKTLIGPFAQILPMTGLPLKGALQDEQLTIINDGGILVMAGKIALIGNYAEMKAMADSETLFEVIEGEQVALPSFVDCHTHICFGGNRAKDYAARNAGKTYLEIAAEGGGIWSTVNHTRAASEAALVAGILSRAQRHLEQGVTTIEVKSGYGLSVAEELKMLRAIQKADKESPADLIATCLAAHIVPKDGQTAQGYLKTIVAELFPILQKENLAQRVDAFIEQGAYTPADVQYYFEAAQKLGLDITVHADQFSTGGSQAAIDHSAISADHLEASGPKEIAALAQSDTIAVALPGASMGLGCAYTPARALLDQGGALAIASDWNPGSAPMGNLLMQAAVLGSYEKLSNAEVLAGITFRAAAALNIQAGTLQEECQADIVAFKTDNYQNILYQQGMLIPAQVWKNGKPQIHK
ncbi:imidazolonepropionase [Sediminicola luteus]|uniref:Imidazolonepropionase n=1 Tax=Sediminicola luteus TaxID=319238 RepID=A0A2A4GAI8_9FLAO|nr:imidazolonepropionase [Sediminicola luteus]PCE65969.1 imidazolonepropionase [Sediminicola luteus]